MAKKIKKIKWGASLAWLISPVAIGVYFTIAIAIMNFYYYVSISKRDEAESNQGLIQVLYMAHQKSIDYRLQARGPRPVSPNLALLAVDDRAVEAIGRWPWPRQVIAKALDRAFEQGAKVVAFDIAFPEVALNPADQVAEAFKNTGEPLPVSLSSNLTKVSEELDGDKRFSQVIKKHSDRFVAGAFYNSELKPIWPPEGDYCLDLVFKRTPAAKQWDKEEVLLSAIDPYQPYIPSGMIEFTKAVLQAEEEATRTQFGPVINRNAELELETKIDTRLKETCFEILERYKTEISEAWKSDILSQENPQEFRFASYEEWLGDLRRRSLPNGSVYVEDWRLNNEKLAEGSKHTGFFNTQQDSDGTIRSKLAIARTGNSYFPALWLKAFLVANGYNASPKLEFSVDTGKKLISNIEITNNETGETVTRIPTDAQGRLLLNYAGKSRMYPYISFADLLSDSPDATISQREYDRSNKTWVLKEGKKVNKAAFLKDKILIAGATAMGIYDLRVTPFEENFPGTETHLNALDNLIRRNFFRTLTQEPIYMPIVILAVGVFLSIALAYLGAIAGLALSASTLVGLIFGDQHFLFSKGLVVSIIWPVFLVGSLYVLMTFYRYLTEERGKKELRQTFQKYVSPAIVEEILSHPDNIELGGRKANLTVFFSDVRGFTTISEKLDPRALSDLLNSYLTPMTEIVFKNRGTLDKYMGDAVMAFFGAPIAYPDHAKYACRCALHSLQKLFELQKEYEKKGLPTIDIGIGLNTGDVNVGNMGSETVRSYTVMGDAVNLASRLEGINKTYGTRIILSEFTYKEVKDNFVCREVDWVRVKGKAQPVKIYELIAEEKVRPAEAEVLKWFAEGYNLYHQQKWAEGFAAFTKNLDLNPNDEVAKLYLERCQDFMKEPPESNWDGVYVMKTK